jgi:hypothetical protein
MLSSWSVLRGPARRTLPCLAPADTIGFSEEAGGTRLRAAFDARRHGPARLFFPVFIRIIRKEEARNMDYLSACPESGRAAQAPCSRRPGRGMHAHHSLPPMAITDGWVMTAGTDNQPAAVAPDISIVPAGRRAARASTVIWAGLVFAAFAGVLMFGGLALLGIATRRARRLDGAAAWAPLLVLAGGLVAAPFYSFDRLVHFILLGLLWGSAWLYMALTGCRQVTAGVAAGAPRSSVVV